MDLNKILATDATDDWRMFASYLFVLEDADPGYVLLKRAVLPYATKLRYVLAWCTFYNPGIAAIACQYEGAKFYDYLLSVYPTAKRASERRHFRGAAGLKALEQWRYGWPKPESLIEECYAPTYLGVRANMKGIAQMGDYFYWKLADIWDTVFDEPVDFTGCEKYMPKVPKQGASLICGLIDAGAINPVSPPLEPDTLVRTMQEITQYIGSVHYPVKPNRVLALQEAETVCCVFKQHVVGDYSFGYRSAKAWKRLTSVQAESPDAVNRLLKGLYAGGIWTPERLTAVSEHM